MAINQNDKVIRKINVNGTPHEISAKYLGDYTYSEINDEFISRIQGNSVSSVNLDPFIKLSWEPGTLNDNLNGLCPDDTDDIANKTGYFRSYTSAGASCLNIKVDVLSWANSNTGVKERFMQTVSGPVTLNNADKTKLIWVNGVPGSGPGHYYRLSERAHDVDRNNRTWSEWKPVNNNYIESLQNKIQLKNITYYDLVNLRNNGLLFPGQSYRIIDYVTTTTQENTKSAKHNFDIIVKAISENALSENASVCRCFNSKRDHGVENTTSDLYNWPDVNNWVAYGSSNYGPTLPPDAIEFMGNSSVSTQLGTRSVTSNSKIRITLLGKKSDNNVIRGFGAALIQNNTIIDIDFGFGTEFYLQLPSGYSDGQYELRFYAYGTPSELINGIDGAGACAESFDATSHFNDSDLGAWEIKYSLDNDTNRFAWADTVNGKGVIYYMKDEFNNECWYDFKNIQFNCVVKQTHNSQEVEFRPDGYDYAYTFTDYDGNDLSLTQNARNNSIKKYTTSGNGLQTLNNTSFICSAVHNNNIEENSYSNVFYVNSCYYNSIGRAFQNNFISAPTGMDRTSIHNNIIGNLFKSNRIQSSFNRNVIGNTTTSCDFFSSFYFNEFGNNSYHIDFNYPVSYCKFGSYIQYCVFNNTAAYQPSVSEMKWCTIGDGLEGAQYIPCCEKVTFEDRVLYNSSSNFHINDVILNDGTKLVEQLVQQHEDQLYVCSVDNGCAVFRYKNTVSEINLGTFDSIESVSSKASEIDICSNQNITRMSFKIDNDSRKYANGFIEQFITGGPYTVNNTEFYYIVQTLYFDGLTQSRQIIYKFIDGIKTIHGVGSWHKIIDHDNSNIISPILYSKNSEVVNIESPQTITGSKRFDSDINLAGKTLIRNGNNIDTGELKVFKANDSTAGFTIRTNGKFSNNVPILEMLATNNNAAYKYQFPQLANTTDPDFVVVKSQLDEEKKYVYIEWEELVSLKDDGDLKPGRKYRITDYVTTTSQSNTQSAGHQFDIIVEALSENTLSEDAKAIQNENDGYFDEANLEAWELKYCLDNGTSRFAWVGSNNKGIIYYMKDEWGNEAPYDFKNIKFASDDTNDDKTYYTFSYVENNQIYDATIKTKTVINNKILPSYDSGKRSLGFNIFKLTTNSFEKLCISNYIGENCTHNTFGTSCACNVLNTFCSYNKFGDECQYNTLEESCKNNIFVNQNKSNTFGVSCSHNKLGNITSHVTFGNNCSYNTVGNNSQLIEFGDSNTRNVLGSYSLSITFGNVCTRNVILNGDPGNVDLENLDPSSYLVEGSSYEPINYMRYITLGDAVQNNIFWTSLQTDPSNYVQMYNIESYIIRRKIELKSDLQAGYMTKIAKNSSGYIKQYCEADLIK